MGKHRLVCKLIGKEEGSEKSVGLDYRFCDVCDSSNDVVGRLSYWRLQGDAAVHGGLLSLVKADLVLFVVDATKVGERSVMVSVTLTAHHAQGAWGVGRVVGALAERGSARVAMDRCGNQE